MGDKAAIVVTSSSEQSTGDKNGTVSPLPLGWTRVKRRRIDEIEHNEDYCEDPFCRKRRAPLTLSTIANETSIPSRSFQGTAVFCLHETNPDWFQGYFFQGTTTWGMLCEQQDVDDCLQCADGGYRVLKTTLYTFSGGVDLPEMISIPNVEWTGGDMMRLLQAEGKMRFEPKQLYTAEKAVPLTKSLFKSLLRKLQASHDSENLVEQDVINIVPDVAIILGEMKVVLPNRREEESSWWLMMIIHGVWQHL